MGITTLVTDRDVVHIVESFKTYQKKDAPIISQDSENELGAFAMEGKEQIHFQLNGLASIDSSPLMKKKFLGGP